MHVTLSDDAFTEFSDPEDVDDVMNDDAFSLEDHFEDLERENGGSYSPFPSKLFALLFILVNSPHHMVSLIF